jgi:hypothetical protein
VKIRVIIRGYADGVLKFEERHDFSESDIDALVPGIARRHGRALRDHELHMIEIEFPDDPDPEERFFRIGTDTRGMVLPVPISRDPRPN